jgi:putative chitinase
MIALDIELLYRIAPTFKGQRAIHQASLLGAIGPVLAGTLAQYAISPSLRAAHFLAQTCHESDGFCTTVEYASGEAYEGRINDLGNTEKGDGVLYKGRGLLQLTGRKNYKIYGDALNLDLTGNPKLAADPKISLLIACEFWKRHKLNDLADRDDLVGIMRCINGGQNGIDDRRIRLDRAKRALGMAVPPAIGQLLPRRHADHSADVIDIQMALRRWGLPITPDGHFGTKTHNAVAQFQRAKGLSPDGIVGPATWTSLMRRQ